jgi:hypothetical protein
MQPENEMRIHKNQIWALGLALLLSACLGRSRTKIRELNTYPDKYQDQTVTVQGKVVETFEISLLSYRVAKIDDGTGQMWVRPQSRAVTEGEEITLTGQFKTGVTIGRKNFGRMVEEPEPVAPQPAAVKKSAPVPQEASAGEKAGVKFVLYGTFVFNLNYNTSPLQPGSFAVFALSAEWNNRFQPAQPGAAQKQQRLFAAFFQHLRGNQNRKVSHFGRPGGRRNFASGHQHLERIPHELFAGQCGLFPAAGAL